MKSILPLFLALALLLGACSTTAAPQTATPTATTAVPASPTPTETLVPTATAEATATLLPTLTPAANNPPASSPAIPQSQLYASLDEAQAAAAFTILTPASVPDDLPLSKIFVDDYADGHQVIRLYYAVASNDAHSLNRTVFLSESNENQELNAQTIGLQFKSMAMDVQEVDVQGQTGYTYWSPAGSAGNSATLAWQRDGLTIFMTLFGDWPQPDAQHPHSLDDTLLTLAGSLEPTP